MIDNPYDEIDDAGKGAWTAKEGDPCALTADLLWATYRSILEQQEENDRRMREWGKEMERHRKENPKRYAAEVQAQLEMFARIGDPVNPIIAHPQQYKRYKARVQELLAGAKPLF